MLALVQSGDYVIVHTPAYQPLTTLAEWRGAEVTAWEAEEGHGWVPSLDRLAGLIRPTTRLLIVNFPHNPTGWCPDTAFVRDLVAIAERHGLLIVSDEVYAGLSLHDGEPFRRLASLTPQAVSLGSLTKTFGMPGVRIGWLATQNAAVLAAARHFRMYLNSYATTPGEFLACLALRHANAILARNTAIARKNLALLDEFFAARPHRFSWHRPLGGTVCFPGDSSQLGRAFLQGSGYLLATSEQLLAGTRHLRLGFGTTGLSRSLAAFQEFVDHYAITEHLED
jgi:aspartate/methionine/tyrosine aminotransferase